jgi:hypothetical protein
MNRKNNIEDHSSKVGAFNFAKGLSLILIDNLLNPIQPSKKLETDGNFSGYYYWTDSGGIQYKAGSSSQSSSLQRKYD